MKQLDFLYCMDLDFDQEIKEHYFTLKCIPRNTRRQKVTALRYNILPHENLTEGMDEYGNPQLYGFQLTNHQKFTVIVRGKVQVGLDVCEDKNANDEMLFRQQTIVTEPGDAIKQLFCQLLPDPDMGPYQKCIHLMHGLHQIFTYESGSTTINTTAEEALQSGKGVCQDYAHIMLSLCRMAGIPARYCTGLLIGEGYSHAWVEVCCHGYWYGMDPTNNVLVSEDHIKFSQGRDYRDCRINRGIFKGSAVQSSRIETMVVDNYQGSNRKGEK